MVFPSELWWIFLAAASDKQKSAAKKINPKRFCDSGLFKIVCCPNYLGELILWTGMLLTGVSALQTVGQWIVAIIGGSGSFMSCSAVPAGWSFGRTVLTARIRNIRPTWPRCRACFRLFRCTA